MLKILLLLLLSINMLQAQELSATVTVNYQNLPIVNKEILVRFQSDVESYLNNTRFTGGDWNYDKIRCSFSISFLSATDEQNYHAQLVVVSQRQIYKSDKFSPMLRVFDSNWNLQYERNQQLYFSPLLFNSLSSLLDYYAFVIIGMDEDSWEKLAGTENFKRAADIVNLGATSRYSKGWESVTGSYNRKDLTDNLLSEKYRRFREAIADYHLGVDLSVKNRKMAQDRVVKMIDALDAIKSQIDLRSVYPKAFFDAKNGELVELLSDYPDKEIFKKLKALDPPHSAKYDEAMQQ